MQISKRRKMEERGIVSTDEKIEILNKSNYRCCHCGKHIGIGSMTVEHVIPLNKAGTDSLVNKVALCESCNLEKSDLVITNRIPLYYRYLNRKPMLELIGYVEEYLDKIGWFWWNNFTESDKMVLSLGYVPSARNIAKYKNRMLNDPRYVLQKAAYSDLDSILAFCRRKCENKGTDLEGYIASAFLMGAIYCCKTSFGEIVGVFSVWMEDYFVTIGCLAYSRRYCWCIINSIYYVLKAIANSLKLKAVPTLTFTTNSDVYSVIGSSDLRSWPLNKITAVVDMEGMDFCRDVFVGFFSEESTLNRSEDYFGIYNDRSTGILKSREEFVSLVSSNTIYDLAASCTFLGRLHPEVLGKE